MTFFCIALYYNSTVDAIDLDFICVENVFQKNSLL